MTNETIDTILGFIVAFTCIEPVLLRVCGPLRNGNLFCLPSYETGDLTSNISRMLFAIQNNSIRNHWPRRGRYAALNLDTLTSFGSVECRCFPNEINPETIKKWVDWLVNIRTLAREWNGDWLQFIERVYNEPKWLLEKVFQNEQLFISCAPQTPMELTHYGVENAYEVARIIQPLYEPGAEKPVVMTRRKDDAWVVFDSPPEVAVDYDDMMEIISDEEHP